MNMSVSASRTRRVALTTITIFLLLLVGKSHYLVPAHAEETAGANPSTAMAEPQAQSADNGAYIPFFGARGIPANRQVHMWVSPEAVAALPTSGPAWASLLSAAQKNTSNPDLSDQDDNTDVYVLAKALVYVRTGNDAYRQQVVETLKAVMGTEKGARTLAVGRNLPAYVIAADLINLPAIPDVDAPFRTWLAGLLTANLDGDTLRSTHETRPNNWGTHSGAARAAIAIYLGDDSELERTAQVFKGFLGDRSAYAGFKFGDLWWQCDPQKPVGINPAGCTIDGHSVDGVVPDDQRRGGGFKWPPPKENYVWEGLQGSVVQAQLLHRAGYAAWSWEDAALLRAAKWLHEQANYPADGDDEWQPWLINAVYGTAFPVELPAQHGKNLGWTDWTAPLHVP